MPQKSVACMQSAKSVPKDKEQVESYKILFYESLADSSEENPDDANIGGFKFRRKTNQKKTNIKRAKINSASKIISDNATLASTKRAQTVQPWSVTKTLQVLSTSMTTAVGCTSVVIVAAVIPIACIVIGILNTNECTVEKYIPITLIVIGSLTLLWLMSALRVICPKIFNKSNSWLHTIVIIFDGCIFIMLISSIIAGSVWTFGLEEPEYEDKNSRNYCDKTTYYFTYILLACIYSIFFIVVLFCCCLVYILPCFQRK